MKTRGQRIAELANNLQLPKYESTKTTSKRERKLLLDRLRDNPSFFPFSDGKEKNGDMLDQIEQISDDINVHSQIGEPTNQSEMLAENKSSDSLNVLFPSKGSFLEITALIPSMITTNGKNTELDLSNLEESFVNPREVLSEVLSDLVSDKSLTDAILPEKSGGLLDHCEQTSHDAHVQSLGQIGDAASQCHNLDENKSCLEGTPPSPLVILTKYNDPELDSSHFEEPVMSSSEVLTQKIITDVIQPEKNEDLLGNCEAASHDNHVQSPSQIKKATNQCEKLNENKSSDTNMEVLLPSKSAPPNPCIIPTTSKNSELYLSDFEEPYMSSGSEYLPPTDGDSSGESAIIPILNTIVATKQLLVNEKKKKCKSKKDEMNKASKKDEMNKAKYKDETDQESNTEDNSDVRDEVEIRNSKKHAVSGKRVRHKRHCCLICHAVICNLPRHLEKKHGNDTEVAKILAIPKCHKKRREEFGKIQRQGDFYHNCEVLRLKKGELILLRLPTEYERTKYTYADYGPCPDCLGFMLKKHIGVHIKNNRCPEVSLNKAIDSRKPIAESTALINGIQFAPLDSDFISNIVNKMRDDEVTAKCKADALIMRFGNMIFEKYHTSQSELVRQYMRQLGRLLAELNRMNGDQLTLTDNLHPKFFDNIVSATKSLCNVYKRPTCRPEFGTPSLGLKIGYNIKKCAIIARGIALRTGNLKQDRELLSFLTLMDLEWNIKISANALNTLHKRKFNASELLPLTSDLLKLNNYLENEIKNLKEEMEKNEIPLLSTWTTFASLLLARIVLFNKRRSGEASKMKIEHYMMRPLWENQSTEELKKSLTSFEQELAKRLIVVEIEGKRGRKVPILLTPILKAGIDLLLRKRALVGINKENPYIFARPKESILNIRGHDVIRKFAEKAELQYPENICGTKLRKYIATVSQIFNLSENETDWLARHLGHDIRVHRDFYRLHENAVELTKVSRILLAVDKGEANLFAGKELKDIELSELPHIEEDEEMPENSDNESNEVNYQEEDIPELSEACAESTKETVHKSFKIKKATVKNPWSKEESEAVITFFRTAVSQQKVPGKEKCEECIEKNRVLSKRKWTDVKFHVKNYLDKIKRQKRY